MVSGVTGIYFPSFRFAVPNSKRVMPSSESRFGLSARNRLRQATQSCAYCGGIVLDIPKKGKKKRTAVNAFDQPGASQPAPAESNRRSNRVIPHHVRTHLQLSFDHIRPKNSFVGVDPDPTHDQVQNGLLTHTRCNIERQNIPLLEYLAGETRGYIYSDSGNTAYPSPKAPLVPCSSRKTIRRRRAFSDYLRHMLETGVSLEYQYDYLTRQAAKMQKKQAWYRAKIDDPATLPHHKIQLSSLIRQPGLPDGRRQALESKSESVRNSWFIHALDNMLYPIWGTGSRPVSEGATAALTQARLNRFIRMLAEVDPDFWLEGPFEKIIRQDFFGYPEKQSALLQAIHTIQQDISENQRHRLRGALVDRDSACATKNGISRTTCLLNSPAKHAPVVPIFLPARA